MKIAQTGPFKRDYKKLPEKIQGQADKTLSLLMTNLYHPSLRAKKIKSRENIWEARVSKDYRISFEITKDTCLLRRIGRHDEILRRP